MMKEKVVAAEIVGVAEWLNEGRRLFGEDYNQWRFKCPVCGNIQTGADFRSAGVDPQNVYQECIGRHMPDRAKNLGSTPAKDKSKSPCDYAAYGLFTFGRRVMPEGGKKATEVFPFAELESK